MAYEFGYNSDGGKVWTREHITGQHTLEFRFITCGTGCAGSPLSLYLRERVGGSVLAWNRAEEYVNTPTVLVYDFVLYTGRSGDIAHYDGNMVMPQYRDSSGMLVGGYALPDCARKRDRGAGCVPYGTGCPSVSISGSSDLPYLNSNGIGGFPQFGLTTNYYVVQGLIAGIIGIILPIILAAAKLCLIGIAIDTAVEIITWLLCVAAAVVVGNCVPCTCGSFPLPDKCDLITSCVAGIVGGGIGGPLLRRIPIVRKWLEKISDELLGGISGGVAGGLCKGLEGSENCPHPKPSPRPRGGGGLGGGGFYKPYPAY